ncbi:phosphotransferase [Alkalimonas amylolytica]|uniref:Phosphotransferase enzyme family protein n=1 Tax=Alkalimonas amylolytica TaxID=152573 RepID=A0A1H3YEQ3_ALKAM|nr:phosphotransferase [Alkalimonas amylolytica]SEA09581.1 Phosphotransferase enzyme family protein [Alkalimonas amylolytica]
MAQPLPATTTYQRAGAAAGLSDDEAEQRIRQLCLHLEFFASHPPIAMKPLSQGSTNLSYWVKTKRGEYVVRHYAPDVTGVCRQQELRCQHAAAVADLAPPPLCLNNHQQVLISQYLPEGKPLALSTSLLAAMANQLVRLHRLQVQTPVLQPGRYLQELKSHAKASWMAADEALFSACIQAVEAFEAMPQDLVLCHLDLHAGNLLWQQQRIWLLDFEYAQLADSSLDLASVLENFVLDSVQSERLLQLYWQQRNAGLSAECWQDKVAAARVLYQGFCWLWYLALPEGKAQAVQHQQRLQFLLQQG